MNFFEDDLFMTNRYSDHSKKNFHYLFNVYKFHRENCVFFFELLKKIIPKITFFFFTCSKIFLNFL